MPTIKISVEIKEKLDNCKKFYKTGTYGDTINMLIELCRLYNMEKNKKGNTK